MNSLLLQQRKIALDILKDTVDYYENNPDRRCFDDSGRPRLYHCDKKCAIGRIIVKAAEYQNKFGGLTHFINNAGKLTSKIKLKYRKLPYQFLYKLQHYHDDERFWNGEKFPYAKFNRDIHIEETRKYIKSSQFKRDLLNN